MAGHLILGQQLDDVIHIILPDGRRVEVQTVSINRGRVRIGFRAPPDVRILRASVLEKAAKLVPAVVPSGLPDDFCDCDPDGMS